MVYTFVKGDIVSGAPEYEVFEGGTYDSEELVLCKRIIEDVDSATCMFLASTVAGELWQN